MGNHLPNRTAAIASGAFLGSKLVNLQAFANAIRSAATVMVTQEQGVFRFKLIAACLVVEQRLEIETLASHFPVRFRC